MPKLVFIAGMLGVGKSTVARQFESDAFCVHADHIQKNAVKRAFPFLKNGKEFHWKAWPQDTDTMHLDLLLRLAINSVAPGIQDYTGNLIIEGAILSNDWFRVPLRAALCEFGHTFKDSDVRLFHLKPSVQQIFDNIHRRACEHEYRQPETSMLPTVEKVKGHLVGYCGSFTQNLWTVFESSESLESKMRNLLISDQ